MRGKIERIEGLVVVTGASSGIGLELAIRAAKDGADLILAADRDMSHAEQEVRKAGATHVESVLCDLADARGLQKLMDTIGDRTVAALFANAGQGEGGIFLDQEWDDISQVINTNVVGTVRLIQLIGRRMRETGAGRILVTGSIAGHMPGPFNLVYNSTKAFIDYFCIGLRNELKDTDIVVTVLEPGPTDTHFFARAGLLDTKVGKQDKADPAKVAEDGYAAILSDEDQVVSGFMNRVQMLFADILPDETVAQMHRRLAEPSNRKDNS